MSADAQSDDEKRDLRGLLGDDYEKASLLKVDEVSELLSLSTRSVYDLRIPRVQLSRGRVRWSLQDVLSFLDDRRQAA